jgi:hypothetical protein
METVVLLITFLAGWLGRGWWDRPEQRGEGP